MPAAPTRLAEFDPLLPLAQLVNYARLSVRTLRGYVDGPPGEEPPCDRIGGKVAVKRYCEAIEGLAVVAPPLEPVPATSAVIERGKASGRA